MGWAEALYFHEPSDLNTSDDFTAVKCAQLLGLVIAFEQFDLAFELITSGVAGDILQKLGVRILAEILRIGSKFGPEPVAKLLDTSGNGLDPCKFMYTDRKKIKPRSEYKL